MSAIMQQNTPQPSPGKHFVCQLQSCNNRCDGNHVVSHCGGRVCDRLPYGYGRHYKCDKCGNVRRRGNHHVYCCETCNHSYCHACCLKKNK
ncbi:unnamed protein product [Rotaria socialis]|uniref:Uncharacterized protein n=2 Tax=Rotaria socialis TaxID=392032 RepID=A0A818BTM3_9BILA|nr:unnamed protein product [Rotaria socialis]